MGRRAGCLRRLPLRLTLIAPEPLERIRHFAHLFEEVLRELRRHAYSVRGARQATQPYLPYPILPVRQQEPVFDLRVPTLAAVGTFAVVLVIGVWLVVVPAVRATSASTTAAKCQPVPPPCTITETSTILPDGRRQTETVVQPAGVQDQLLAGAALPLLELILVLLSAFVASAVVQRTLWGDFAITLGPLTVPELADTTLVAVEDLRRRTEAIRARVEELRGVTELLDGRVGAGADAVERLHQATQTLGETMHDFSDWATRVEQALKDRDILP